MAKHKNAPHQKQATTSKKLSHDSSTMMKWFALLAAIISVAISFVTVEPTIPIRYMLTALFCLGFTAYFFMVKKYTIPTSYPLLVKLVFGFGIFYFVWNAIALNFAINPAAGLYELFRHLLNLLILFFLIETIRRARIDDLIIICKVIAVVSILHSVIGIMQFYGAGFLNIPGANAQPYGLMANRNLYGSAQALVIPFVLYLWSAANKAWKKLAMAGLALLLISVLLSQTRSAWIATVVIFTSSFIFLFITHKGNRKPLMKQAVIAAISIIILFTFILFINKSSGIENTISERAVSFTTGTNKGTETADNVGIRFLIWKKTIVLIKDHMVWGTGLDNWKLGITAYGTAGTPWTNGTYTPDRVHNIYLQVMAESGIPGFLFFIGLWLVIIIIGIGLIIKNISTQEKVFVGLMLAGMFGFASDGMFSFPTERIEHSFYLILMGAGIIGIYLKHNTLQENKMQTVKPLIKWLFIGVALVNIFIAYKKYNFESAYNRALAFEKESRYAEELNEAESGKTHWVTVNPEGYPLEMRSGIAYKELRNPARALEDMQAALKYNPYSPVILTNIGTVYTDLKQYDKAIEYYNKSLKYAPDFQLAKINLAVNYFEVARYKDVISILETVDLVKYPELKDILKTAKQKILEGK